MSKTGRSNHQRTLFFATLFQVRCAKLIGEEYYRLAPLLLKLLPAISFASLSSLPVSSYIRYLGVAAEQVIINVSSLSRLELEILFVYNPIASAFLSGSLPCHYFSPSQPSLPLPDYTTFHLSLLKLTLPILSLLQLVFTLTQDHVVQQPSSEVLPSFSIGNHLRYFQHTRSKRQGTSMHHHYWSLEYLFSSLDGFLRSVSITIRKS